MISATGTVATLWGIWLVGWLITARATAKSVFEESVTAQLRYRLFIGAGALLVFFHPSGLGGFERQLIPRRPVVDWSGVLLVAIGLGFAGWARYHLGRLWSGRVTLKENHAIIRSGPYGIVRHPIYTGLLLAVVGSFLVQPTPAALAGVALLTVGFIVKIRHEERLLTRHFGETYDAYRRDVRILIPYVW